MPFKLLRLFWFSLGIALSVIAAKYALHAAGGEIIAQSSLHNSVLSGVFFVVGFLLSATIADYKESERIPAEFSSVLENMYDDARSIHGSYPDFDLDAFRKQLLVVARRFKNDVREKSHDARHEVHRLSATFAAMETAKVPPNFIVKLKQQQAQLARALFRVTYIQKIRFIPSATILARSIVVLSALLLLFTDIDPFYGGMAITAIIVFILTYITLLINVISTPFQSEGKTRDDVSLFLIDEAANYLKKK